jgi:hypothetical protein
MRIAIAVLLVLTISACAVIKPHSKANVWQRVDDLNRAIFETKEKEALNDLVSGNVTYGHSGGKIEDKTTMIENAVNNKSVYKNIVTEKLSIHFSGNNAIARFNYRAIEKKGNEEAPLNLGILQVWEKDGKKWVLLARQSVKITAVN